MCGEGGEGVEKIGEEENGGREMGKQPFCDDRDSKLNTAMDIHRTLMYNTGGFYPSTSIRNFRV